MIRITSDGTAHGTNVSGEDGKPIKGITKIEIMPLIPGSSVRAVVTFDRVILDMHADRVARINPTPQPTPVRAPPAPKPPLARMIREDANYICGRCQSSAVRSWWLFGPRKCINPNCGK